jgi:hypothetical protein
MIKLLINIKLYFIIINLKVTQDIRFTWNFLERDFFLISLIPIVFKPISILNIEEKSIMIVITTKMTNKF